jgi:putative endonuclease
MTMQQTNQSTNHRQALGLLGERIAARWMRRQGWSIVAHRFRSGHRDVDLVVRRGNEVAFVEVKARRGDAFGGPVGAVGFRKQRELGRSARVWVDRFGSDVSGYRFDVIGVLISGQKVRIRHIENAFPLV